MIGPLKKLKNSRLVKNSPMDRGFPAFQRGVYQPGLADSCTINSQNPGCSPVYRPTIRSNPPGGNRLLTVLTRLFYPETRRSVVKSLETISLTPTLEGWEDLNWDEKVLDTVELQADYVFTPEQRTTLLTLFGLERLYHQPICFEEHAAIHAPHSESEEATPGGRLVSNDHPPANVVLPTPVFPVFENWLATTWSRDMTLMVKYVPRDQKWSNTISLAPGKYRLRFDVQFDGSNPVFIDLVRASKAQPLGFITFETLSSIQDYEFQTRLDETAFIITKVSSYMRTTGHKKDLIQEGVEAKPGPMILDSWMVRAKVAKAWPCTLPALDNYTENRFNALAGLGFDIGSDDDVEIAETGGLRDNTAKNRPPQNKASDKDKEKESLDIMRRPPKTKVFDQAASTFTRDSAILRIATKLDKDVVYATSFVSMLPSLPTQTIRRVADVAWGKGFSFFCWLNKVTTSEFVCNVVDSSEKPWKKRDDMVGLVEELGSSGYVEAQARVHNKLIHCLNGNIFSTTMQDVDNAPTFWSMVSTPQAASPYEPMASSINYHGDDWCGMISNAIAADGRVLKDVRINYPCSGLQLYRTLRGMVYPDGVHHRIELAIRKHNVQIIKVRSCDYWVNNLRPTRLSTTLNNTQLEPGYIYKTQSDFDIYDILTVNSIQELQGFSFERQIYVLLLLQSAIRYSQLRNIPPSLFTCGSDFLRPGTPEFVQFKWNVFDDDQFANETQYFPFRETSGMICFHTSMETVPKHRLLNAVIIPTSVMSNGCRAEMIIALLVMSIAEYPFMTPGWELREPATVESGQQLWHIPLEDRDANENWEMYRRKHFDGQVAATWLLNHATINLPGMVEIDVVLPRRNGSRVPRTSMEATSTANIVPTYGSNMRGHPTTIPINYEGGGRGWSCLSAVYVFVASRHLPIRYHRTPQHLPHSFQHRTDHPSCLGYGSGNSTEIPSLVQ